MMRGETVKNKVIFFLNLVLALVIAFSFPICFQWIYLDITGHSKGFDYDLGSEKSVSVMVGAIELIIWLLLAVPSNIYIFGRIKRKTHKFALAAVYVLLSVLCVFMIGGWGEFAEFFK